MEGKEKQWKTREKRGEGKKGKGGKGVRGGVGDKVRAKWHHRVKCVS